MAEALVVHALLHHLAKLVQNPQVHGPKVCAKWLVPLLHVRPVCARSVIWRVPLKNKHAQAGSRGAREKEERRVLADLLHGVLLVAVGRKRQPLRHDLPKAGAISQTVRTAPRARRLEDGC
jgi:hypothetical protein